MPRYYVYKGVGDNHRCNVCQLASNQCSYIKRNGQRCRNRVVLTNPFCWTHSYEMFGVRVKDSTVFPGQKGLFAERDNYGGGLAFRTGDLICPYYGDIGPTSEEETAPYAVRLNSRSDVDADCYRSLASNANSAARTNRNRNAKIIIRRSDPRNAGNYGEIYAGQPILAEHLSATDPPNFRYANFEATNNIRVGEEILVSYGRSYRFHDDHVNTGYLRNEGQARRKYCSVQPIQGSGMKDCIDNLSTDKVKRDDLEESYKRGIGAWKTNPSSVRNQSGEKGKGGPKMPKEQWACARAKKLSVKGADAGYDQDLVGKGVKADTLKKILESSYTGEEVEGFKIDENLSDPYAIVFSKNGKAIVAHRGTDTTTDWGNNLVFGLLGKAGYKFTNRYKTSENVQKMAEEKYGAENVLTVGHSQGGLLAEMLGQNSNEIITVNKATRPQQYLVGKPPNENQYDIRSQKDIVSSWDPYGKTKKYQHPRLTVLENEGNLVAEHSINILDRMGDEVIGSDEFVIGEGISEYTKNKAKQLGVKVRKSKQPKKKIDVILDGEVVASVGDKAYEDYASLLKKKGKDYADKRRALYKKRHEHTRHKVGTPSYYADQLLW